MRVGSLNIWGDIVIQLMKTWLKIRLLVTICFTLISSSAFAEDWGTVYEKYFNYPHASAEDELAPIGRVRKVTTANGIYIHQVKRANGEVESRLRDQSGKGGVLCSRQAMMSLKFALNFCPNLFNEAILNDVDWGMKQTYKFIAKNSIPHVSEATLAKQDKDGFELGLAELNSRRFKANEKQKICSTGGINDFWPLIDIALYVNEPDFDLRREVIENLSVQRLPAVHLCPEWVESAMDPNR